MRRPVRRVLLVTLVVAAIGGAVALAVAARRPWVAGSAAWRSVDAQIARSYPAVPTITTTHLAAWMADPAADPSHAPPLLLDARTEAEFAVSHLPGALRVDPDAEVAALRATVQAARGHDMRGEQPVVVYCSVGWRSARVANALRESGVGDVRNVQGSIFRWAAEGRPLVAGGRPVATVHPFDAVWGRLLPPPLRAERAR